MSVVKKRKRVNKQNEITKLIYKIFNDKPHSIIWDDCMLFVYYLDIPKKEGEKAKLYEVILDYDFYNEMLKGIEIYPFSYRVFEEAVIRKVSIFEAVFVAMEARARKKIPFVAWEWEQLERVWESEWKRAKKKYV